MHACIKTSSYKLDIFTPLRADHTPCHLFQVPGHQSSSYYPTQHLTSTLIPSSACLSAYFINAAVLPFIFLSTGCFSCY